MTDQSPGLVGPPPGRAFGVSTVQEGRDLGPENLSCPPDEGTGKPSTAESQPSTLVADAGTGGMAPGPPMTEVATQPQAPKSYVATGSKETTPTFLLSM